MYRVGDEVWVKGKIVLKDDSGDGLPYLIDLEIRDETRSRYWFPADQLRPVDETCKWELNAEHESRMTSCGGEYHYGDLGGYENELIYCPCCGRRIEVME